MGEKHIKLTSIGRTVQNRKDFRKEIFGLLGEKLYEYSSQQELLYNILRKISPLNKSLKNTAESIEAACKKANLHLRYDRFSDKTAQTFSYAESFLNDILRLECPPNKAYITLLSNANSDLKSITELIKKYESQQNTEKNSSQNVINSFHKRCIVARDEILDYIIYKVKNKALIECEPKLGLDNILSLYKKFSWPYEYCVPNTEHYYDSQKLDVITHRIGNYTLEDGNRLAKLYKIDKLKFYRTYFRHNSIESIFKEIEAYLHNLPLSNNREEIFLELEKAFKRKSWLSFYALALPQVEGLFAEMCRAVNPNDNLGRKGLSAKVFTIRSHHYLSKYYFDYFEYYIPELRNSFAHTGYVEDVQSKSFDLLVDIRFVLQIFDELENPLVKVTKLIRRKDADDFLTIEDFAHYFSLLNELKSLNHYREIEKDVIEFEKFFLAVYCTVDSPAYEIYAQIDDKINQLTDKLNSLLGFQIGELDLAKINKNQIQKMLESEEKKNSLKSVFNSYTYSVDFLYSCHVFLFNYEKYLPSLKNDTKENLKKYLTKYKVVLSKIVEIRNQLIE